jgi:hypothetical protein
MALRQLIPSTFNEVMTFLGVIVGVIGGVASFLWGIYVWQQQAILTAETRRIEATKPFLERQLKLYTEASQVVAVLATSQDPEETLGARKRFLQLYWGELALVENDNVAKAIAKVKEAMDKGSEQEYLTSLSLNLAQACRNSLARSWGVDIWTMPDRAGASGKP